MFEDHDRVVLDQENDFLRNCNPRVSHRVIGDDQGNIMTIDYDHNIIITFERYTGREIQIDYTNSPEEYADRTIEAGGRSDRETYIKLAKRCFNDNNFR